MIFKIFAWLYTIYLKLPMRINNLSYGIPAKKVFGLINNNKLKIAISNNKFIIFCDEKCSI